MSKKYLVALADSNEICSNIKEAKIVIEQYFLEVMDEEIDMNKAKEEIHVFRMDDELPFEIDILPSVRLFDE